MVDAKRFHLFGRTKTRKQEIARLKEAELFRRKYLGDVAHELKTPIFNIQGYISTLLDGGLEDELINRKFLERAQRSIDRLIRIVGDLDTISRLESDMARLHLEYFDVAALAREIAEQVEMAASAKNIKITVEGENPVRVFADKHYVGQVLINLVSNSITYGREGGSTHIRFRDTLDRVPVDVEDTGIGIAAEHIPHIFTRFYRTDTSRARQYGGTGLGLAICKHIVEAHGERITLRSEPGVGTTFSFSLKKFDTL